MHTRSIYLSTRTRAHTHKLNLFLSHTHTSAQVVVGMHGAGLANAVFCEEGAHLVSTKIITHYFYRVNILGHYLSIGAGLANAVFCEEGAHLVEFFAATVLSIGMLMLIGLF